MVMTVSAGEPRCADVPLLSEGLSRSKNPSRSSFSPLSPSCRPLSTLYLVGLHVTQIFYHFLETDVDPETQQFAFLRGSSRRKILEATD